MSDFYTEQLVKRRTTAKTIMAKIGLVLLGFVIILFSFFTPFSFIVAAAVIFIVYLLFKRMNVEFEYLYVNGELDVDKIMSKEKRKRIFSTSISEMEVIAIRGSHELDAHRNAKILDFSSQEEGRKVYEMVVMKGSQKIKVVFEPNEVILDGMRMMAPRKVFI